MAILAECPICHIKQALKNKRCKCGEDLDRAKRSKRVKYWIDYQIPRGKVRREYVGTSIEEARDAEGKRRVQKRENRIFDMLPQSNMTFKELTEWYLDLDDRKSLKSYDTMKDYLSKFNGEYGHVIVGQIKPVDLEKLQAKRKNSGLADATIDQEIRQVRTMINKAFDNDMVGGHVVKAFKRVKPKLKKGSNARKRTITIENYAKMIRSKAPQHTKAMTVMGMNTGMRSGELRLLRWTYIDKKNMFIRLPEEIVKEGKAKNIPINHHVKRVLDSQPHAIGHDFVFTYKGEPIIQRNGIKKSFRTLCEKAGVPYGRKDPEGVTFHDIRRTVKTNMFHAGVNRVYRDMILGHSLEGMDIHYLVIDEDSAKRAMDQYTEWLDRELEAVSANLDQDLDQKPKNAES